MHGKKRLSVQYLCYSQKGHSVRCPRKTFGEYDYKFRMEYRVPNTIINTSVEINEINLPEVHRVLRAIFANSMATGIPS